MQLSFATPFPRGYTLRRHTTPDILTGSENTISSLISVKSGKTNIPFHYYKNKVIFKNKNF